MNRDEMEGGLIDVGWGEGTGMRKTRQTISRCGLTSEAKPIHSSIHPFSIPVLCNSWSPGGWSLSQLPWSWRRGTSR